MSVLTERIRELQLRIEALEVALRESVKLRTLLKAYDELVARNQELEARQRPDDLPTQDRRDEHG